VGTRSLQDKGEPDAKGKARKEEAGNSNDCSIPVFEVFFNWSNRGCVVA